MAKRNKPQGEKHQATSTFGIRYHGMPDSEAAPFFLAKQLAAKQKQKLPGGVV